MSVPSKEKFASNVIASSSLTLDRAKGRNIFRGAREDTEDCFDPLTYWVVRSTAPFCATKSVKTRSRSLMAIRPDSSQTAFKAVGCSLTASLPGTLSEDRL